MKQRINCSQLAELTEAQKAKLREWWKPEYGDMAYIPDPDGGGLDLTMVVGDVSGGYIWDTYHASGVKPERCLPQLSIGQMIELLATEERPEMACDLYGGKVWKVFKDESIHAMAEAPELCDALWAAVKAVL